MAGAEASDVDEDRERTRDSCRIGGYRIIKLDGIQKALMNKVANC